MLEEEENSKVIEHTSCGIDELNQGKKKMLRIQENVDKKSTPSKNPYVHVLSLDNSRPKLFPWRSIRRWLKPITYAPPW